MSYDAKYLKYKKKYLNLKSKYGYLLNKKPSNSVNNTAALFSNLNLNQNKPLSSTVKIVDLIGGGDNQNMSDDEIIASAEREIADARQAVETARSDVEAAKSASNKEDKKEDKENADRTLNDALDRLHDAEARLQDLETRLEALFARLKSMSESNPGDSLKKSNSKGPDDDSNGDKPVLPVLNGGYREEEEDVTTTTIESTMNHRGGAGIRNLIVKKGSKGQLKFLEKKRKSEKPLNKKSNKKVNLRSKFFDNSDLSESTATSSQASSDTI
jgi:hypothetical protein